MKTMVLVLTLSFGFVGLSFGQTNEHTVLTKFLAGESLPLVECETFRRMEARNSDGKVIAWMELKVWVTGGKELHYQILKEEKEDSKKGGVVRKAILELLHSEREQLQTASFKKSGFTKENYIFTPVEAVVEEYKTSVTAKRKGGLLLNGSIFLSPASKLLRSEGVLTKNPSFWFKKTEVFFTYDEIYGVTVPLHYNSKIKVRLFGDWTFSTEYKYISVNGVAVPEKQ